MLSGEEEKRGRLVFVINTVGEEERGDLSMSLTMVSGLFLLL